MLVNGDAAEQPGLIKDTSTQGFRQDVIAESMKQPVLVDFWAPWCGPCKQLTPVIEKVVKAARGKVRLVKMNIDEYPEIPGQLGIQSIPAVIAFKQGQPIDGFMGAQPESQVKAFIEKLVGAMGPGQTEELIAAAKAATEAGDAAGASELYAHVLELEPDNVAAIAGWPSCISISAISRGRRASSAWCPRRRPPIPRSRPCARPSSWHSRPPRSATRPSWRRRSPPIRRTIRPGSTWRWR